MTNAEKLEALIQYAREHGLRWDGADILNFAVKFKKGHLPVYFELSSTYTWEETDDFGDKTGVVHKENNGQALSMQELLFNKDFSRALFGDGPNCSYCGLPPHNMHPNPCPEGSNVWPYLWEYHLQQAVISKAVFGERLAESLCHGDINAFSYVGNCSFAPSSYSQWSKKFA